MSFVCPLCYKSFSSNSALIYHTNHNVCTKNKIICSICNKEFTSLTGLTYHIDKQVCSKKSPQLLKKLVLKKSPADDLLDKFTQLEKKCAQLEGENKALKEHPQTINNSNQINIVVPPAFLSMDSYQKLTQLLPRLLHNALAQHPANFIKYLIQETNCNPNMPLYNSVKITNKKDIFAQVSDGHKYIYASKKSIITQLIENKKNLLEEYIDNNGDKYGKLILKKYQNYIDLLVDDKDAQKELEIEIICMLLNASEMIGSDDWSKKLLDDLKRWDTLLIDT